MNSPLPMVTHLVIPSSDCLKAFVEWLNGSASRASCILDVVHDAKVFCCTIRATATGHDLLRATGPCGKVLLPTSSSEAVAAVLLCVAW